MMRASAGSDERLRAKLGLTDLGGPTAFRYRPPGITTIEIEEIQ
jgi:hypothetical protein